MATNRRKILFFAEGATLAHVARPYVLASALDRARFEVVFARPPGYAWLTDKADFRVMDLACQPGEVFVRRLERGAPLYDFPTLKRYLRQDLDLIEAEQPDVVVGDFRLSLSVSARLSGVPYATLCDAYWSPERPLKPPLPVLPFTPYMPVWLATGLFRAISPLAFRMHARPMERLRTAHGLPSLGHDLRLCYTDADLRLFANPHALFPEVVPGPQAAFLGPVAWSPSDRADLDLPPGEDPLAYVTMGSSGDPRLLAALVPVLEEAGYRVALATAGKPVPANLASARVRVFDFLPGDQLCRLSQLVVCNGGSPTTNQALKHGVPVLGLARNMDQLLNMQAIESYGAGLTLRADRAHSQPLRRAVVRLAADSAYRQKARFLAAQPPGGSLASGLDSLCPANTAPPE